jgi:hypothetical protein
VKLLLHRRSALALATALIALAAAPRAPAIERLMLTVERVQRRDVAVSGASVELELTGRSALDLTARIARVDAPFAGLPPLTRLRLTCAALSLRSPDFGCRDGRLETRAGELGALTARLSIGYDEPRKLWTVDAAGLPLAGGTVRLAGSLAPETWTLVASGRGIGLPQALRLAHPWVQVPAGYTVSGHGDVRIALTSGPTLTIGITAHSTDLGYSNAAGTVVGQNLAASVAGTLARERGALTLAATLRGSHGQALSGPVLLDFAAHPLVARIELTRTADLVRVARLDVAGHGLVRAQARGVLRLGAHPALVSAHVAVGRLSFPAAYTSFLQLPLAATALGALTSSGEASASIDIADDSVTRLDCALRDINLADPQSKLLVERASGAIHWTAAAGAALATSHLAWRRIGAYGLTGGATRLSFATWQRNFALLGGATRLPILNGALIVHTLVARDLGTPEAKVDFDADVTPISMPLLSRAFGWPVMNGAVSGHIPLVRYRDHALSFDGDLVAKVFDGTITGSHIALENPLGSFPQLTADVSARGLDLDLVTHTFAIGSMTGRVDADVRGLELFDWSPVAFDARLYTMPGDRSRHRISQRAVTSIAGLGGGAGAVTAALESGVLRFFHTFHYARIGIGCRLENGVCLMSGIAPAPDGGYYLVQGSGVPQLNIIGNVRQVDWRRLMSQIAAGMRTHNIVVSEADGAGSPRRL